MKRFFWLMLISLASVSCNRESLESSFSLEKKEFDRGEVHFTILKGSTFDTKSFNENESFTITGEYQSTSITLYGVEKKDENGFSFFETYFPDGTLISTSTLYKEIVLDFIVSPGLQYNIYTEGPTTKAKKEGEKWKDCVVREANEISETMNEGPIGRATCEWVPCETIALIVAAIDCTR